MSDAAPRPTVVKHVWLVRLLKGADRVPLRVVDPTPLEEVTKLEEFTAAHWFKPVQVQLGAPIVKPFTMVLFKGSPVIEQGFRVAFP